MTKGIQILSPYAIVHFDSDVHSSFVVPIRSLDSRLLVCKLRDYMFALMHEKSDIYYSIRPTE